MKRIIVVGGGPAGLYFALLARKRFPQAAVEVFEQNPQGATYGFGIVLADRGLHRLQKADPESYDAIMSASFMTRHRIIGHPSEAVFIEGGGYGGAIARLRLLNILEDFCTRSGVTIHYATRIEELSRLGHADLVVGADGVNSALRESCATAFGTTSWRLTNRMAWYGTQQHFPYPRLAFKKNELGYFVAAGYPYTETLGTFVAECDANTWFASGMDRMTDDERRVLAERVFAEELKGQPLISNKSTWNALPVIRNKEWYVGNYVLIGDALHSAHPSIGSGTRIAMEDSISLINALSHTGGDVPAALPLFRRVREPQKRKLVFAAERSFSWYESFAARLESLEPIDFVFDFLMRTGRIDLARLTSEYPHFMERYAHRWTRHETEALAAGPSASGARAVSAGTTV